MTRFAIYARVYPEFYREVENHSIPTDLEAAKALSSSPAALDLFAWLSYRCFMAKGRERVPLFGDFVLVSQLGSVEYARMVRNRPRAAALEESLPEENSSEVCLLA